VIQMLAYITDQVRAFVRRDDAQDAFEYMLIIGGVSVAVVVGIAVLAFGVPGIRTATCAAIATISGYSSFAC
jgi:Flp pilus assembly pilin Flp